MAAMRCGAKMILQTGAAAFLWTEHASAGFSRKLGYHGHFVLCAVFRAAKKCVTAVPLSVFMLRLVMSLSAIAYPDRPQLSEKLNTRYKRMACLNTV